MINCCFDLTNMMFRSMFSINGYEKGPAYSYNSQKELDELMRKIATDISLILRTFNPGRASLCMDSSSWRKEINIDENDGYKAQRVKNEDINWDNIYKLINEFTEIANDYGFITTKINKAEADDNLALWSTKLRNIPNQHIILISGDEDIRQLAYFNKELNSSVTIFNPFLQGKNATKKLYHTKEFLEWLNSETDTGDIFNMNIDTNQSEFKKLLNDKKIKFIEVIPDDIALYKIFCGDKGDNIPAFYTWMTTSGKGELKETRITDSKYNKIKTNLGLNNINDLLNIDLNLLQKELEAITKTPLNISVKERLNRQIKLVLLNESIFPEEIVHNFNNHYEEAILKPRGNFSNIYMYQLLEGTRYITYGNNVNTAKEADIFKSFSNKGLF